MSRQTFIAAALAALAFSSAAHAAGSTLIASTDSQGGALPSVTVQGAAFAHDYTGMAPLANAAQVSVWTPAAARDYTGDVSSVSEELVARVPAWNIAMAHDYTAQ